MFLKFTALLFTVVLSACDTLPSKFKAHENLDVLPPPEELLPYAWTLVYQDYQSVIFNVDDYLPDFVLFANRDGDQVWFDGKSILKAQVDSHEILYHQREPESLTVFLNSQEESEHNCFKWSNTIVDKSSYLEQVCVGENKLVRSVRYDSTGMVREIAVRAAPHLTIRLVKIIKASDL